MKDRMERFVVLPFAAGCVSTSSISVCPQQPTGTRRVPKHNTISLSPTESRARPRLSVPLGYRPIGSVPLGYRSIGAGIKEQEDTLSSEIMRNSFRFLALPKPNISIGLQRLSKSLKSFSHLFVFKEEMQEVEVEMEIGHPTDVKHVTHIGLDGSATTTNHPSTTAGGGCCECDNNNNNNNLNNFASEFLSLRPISLTQFELAMSAQHDAPLIH